MTPERYERIEKIFGLAMEREGEDLERLLDEACGGDAELRREVEALLASHHRAGDFLAKTEVMIIDFETPYALAPGAVVDGKYRVETLLGRGGMGEVYRATQLSLDRTVALKVLRGELAANATMLTQFRREAHAIARLRHPNIVTIHEYGVENGVGAFFVMEHLEGRSLRQELQDRGRLRSDEIVAMTLQICAAVGAAHDAGVVHRDLKPDNIFLEADDGEPRVKVLDFGIAKLVARAGRESEVFTIGGGLVGTPTYMAPEQATGGEVDVRTDVYSLGCVLYELLTGRPPFVGENNAQVLEQQLTSRPRPPREEAPEAPAWLEAVILRALDKNPRGRFQTVDELRRALGPEAARDTEVDLGPEARSTSNLPSLVDRLVGRRDEAAAVAALLLGRRLVTLVGPGGIGKTRLALALASELEDHFAHGVWLVELASIADPQLVGASVAAVLDVREERGEPLAKAFERALHGRELLVVLDNCEHLVGACARLASDLLRACPGVRILATSREALGIEGEARHELAPMRLPAESGAIRAADLAGCESVQLFVERARAVRSGFSLSDQNVTAVAEICRRLDGIPLAIELAAARVRVLTADQIRERLRDRFRLLASADKTAPPRHQTLRAAIDSSHELLDDDEQALFARLSVFVGGCELEAVEAVCPGGRVDREDVVDLLTRLVDKSLVRAVERDSVMRYGMLESIGEYARERLAESEEQSALAAAHAEWFAALVERARAHWQGPEEGVWLARLAADNDNLRAVLQRETGADGDPERAARMCDALMPFWLRRSQVTEGRRWLAAVTARGDSTPAAARATALTAAGHLAANDGDLTWARGALEESLALHRQLGDAPAVCRTLGSLSSALAALGEYDSAAELADEALAVARELGDWHRVSWCLHFAANVQIVRHDHARSERLLRERIELCREHESLADLAISLVMICSEVWQLGKREEAVALLDEGETIARREGFGTFVGFATYQRGNFALWSGEFERAVDLHKDALRAFWDLAYRPGVAYSLDSLSYSLGASGRHGASMRAAGAAAALWAGMYQADSPQDLAEKERYLGPVREALGGEAEALFAEGRLTPLAELVASLL